MNAHEALTKAAALLREVAARPTTSGIDRLDLLRAASFLDALRDSLPAEAQPANVAQRCEWVDCRLPLAESPCDRRDCPHRPAAPQSETPQGERAKAAESGWYEWRAANPDAPMYEAFIAGAALRSIDAARGRSGGSDTARAAYAAVNPLGGPASMFRVIAERLEAGEDYAAVLADYGLSQDSALRASQAEAGQPQWRRVLDDDLPSGPPVDDGTTLYTFDNYPGHWEYDLPPVPTESVQPNSEQR